MISSKWNILFNWLQIESHYSIKVPPQAELLRRARMFSPKRSKHFPSELLRGASSFRAIRPGTLKHSAPDNWRCRRPGENKKERDK